MAIDTARGARTGPQPVVIVDPTLGDGGRLYVPADVAKAVMEELVPRADILAPNVWELSYLTGAEIGAPSDALAAARSLGRPVLVSSQAHLILSSIPYSMPRIATPPKA